MDGNVDVDVGVVPRSVEVLAEELCRGAANLTAAEAQWLLDLAEFDRRDGWVGWGVRSWGVSDGLCKWSGHHLTGEHTDDHDQSRSGA